MLNTNMPGWVVPTSDAALEQNRKARGELAREIAEARRQIAQLRELLDDRRPRPQPCENRWPEDASPENMAPENMPRENVPAK